MLRNLLFGLIALTGLTLTLPAAAIAPILSISDAVEADEITVSMPGKKGGNGHAIARGCSGCPISAEIDADTLFFLKGVVVPANKAEQLSGEAGTIVFSKDRVIRIRWDTGSLK